jgi:hypothetical protein
MDREMLSTIRFGPRGHPMPSGQRTRMPILAEKADQFPPDIALREGAFQLAS